ncbi:ATP-binding protein [Oceanobacillus manasiensis]|uniref:ATP-binding protein n=1 Tax=Oceanobacillus manasiensis TaxID=586413 RepID=UPI0005AA4F59|nr:ATP-binding protein [Oceanobacillus manasiensis]
MTNHAFGIITKVYFNKVVIEVPDTTLIQHNYLGDLYTLNGLNDFVTIYKNGSHKYIYQIIGLYEQEKPLNVEEQSKFSQKAFFEAAPVGEILYDRFEYGLSTFPIIGEEAFLTDVNDINTMLLLSDSKMSIMLGKLTTQDLMPKISVDSILTNHMSILGNTGSGKSTTVRKLLNEIARCKKDPEIDISKANFIIFDVHGEYTDLPPKMTTLKKVNDISINLERLTVEDWMNLLQPSHATQRPVLLNALKLANHLNSNNNDVSWIKAFCALELFNNQSTDAVPKRAKIKGLLEGIDSEKINEYLKHYNAQFGSFNPPNIDDTFRSEIRAYVKDKTGYEYEDAHSYLISCLESTKCKTKTIKDLKIAVDLVLLLEEAKGNNQIRTFCSTLITRMDNLDATYSNNLFSEDLTRQEELEGMLLTKQAFTVFDCSFIDEDVLLFFTSYVLRSIFNAQLERKMITGHVTKSYNFVFDEAHKYISEKNEDNIVDYSKMFRTVAKEGRKFGVFLILSSQRPGELSKTVLSQCNNFILHRIRNNIDLDQMRKSIPYINDGQLNRLSFLRRGVVLIVGDSFAIPMEVKIDGEEFGDPSKTVIPSEIWKQDKPTNFVDLERGKEVVIGE